MRHILVPTDFSETAQAALEYAVDLCRDLSGRLTLLHVIFSDKYQHEFPGLDAIGYLSVAGAGEHAAADSVSQLQQWRELAEARLRDCIKPEWRNELKVETAIAEGRPSQKIVEFACKNAGDMIVMGTHGRGPVANFFLGSVTENVLRSSACPVVVVRHR